MAYCEIRCQAFWRGNGRNGAMDRASVSLLDGGKVKVRWHQCEATDRIENGLRVFRVLPGTMGMAEEYLLPEADYQRLLAKAQKAEA